MKVVDAIRVFGSRAAVAQALGGTRHRSAVYQWKEMVPMLAAFTLTRAAPPGALPVNPADYEQMARERKVILKRARSRRRAKKH